MTDFRIEAGRSTPGGTPESGSVVEALIQRADDIVRRCEIVSANVPYRAFGESLVLDGLGEVVRALGVATWRRLGDEIPPYGFAEDLGRDYREAGATLGALLLCWQILRRAIHLVLAERQIRAGQGDEKRMREMALMNYCVDRAIDASVVGYVMNSAADTEPEAVD